MSVFLSPSKNSRFLWKYRTVSIYRSTDHQLLWIVKTAEEEKERKLSSLSIGWDRSRIDPPNWNDHRTTRNPVPGYILEGWWDIPRMPLECEDGEWLGPIGPKGLTNPWIGFPCMELPSIERVGTIPGKGIPWLWISWEVMCRLLLLPWFVTGLPPCKEPLRCWDMIGTRQAWNKNFKPPRFKTSSTL